jgi:hypothetical protein
MDYQTLVLDDDHNQAVTTDTDKPPFDILAGEAIQLSGEEISFLPIEAEHKFKVNALQVILGENLIYQANWDGRGTIILDKSTLFALRGPEEFPGFSADQKGVIAIGGTAPNPEYPQKINFMVAYALLLYVH